MAIGYRKTIKKYMDNGEIKEKYFAKILSSGEIHLKDIAREVEHASSMTAEDFEAAVKHLARLLEKHHANGKTVDLEELGRFKPCFNSKATDKLKDVSSEIIDNVRINYKASKELLKAVKETPLVEDRRLDEYGRLVEYSHTKNKRVQEL